MKLKLIIFIAFIATIHYSFSFTPKRYERLLRESLETLENRLDRLDQKIAAHKKPRTYPLVGSFSLTHEQQQTLVSSRTELLKQLEKKRAFLKKRILDIKKQQLEIFSKSLLNAAQEARAIEKATLQQMVADLQEQLAGIALTQGILEKQRNEQLTQDFLVPDRQAVASFAQKWAVERVNLEKQLKAAQEKLTHLHSS